MLLKKRKLNLAPTHLRFLAKKENKSVIFGSGVEYRKSFDCPYANQKGDSREEMLYTF